MRPLLFAEILGRAFRLLIENLGLLLVISAIVWVPEAFMVHLHSWLRATAGILVLVAMPFFQAALIFAATELYLDRPVTVEQSYRAAYDIYWPLVTTSLILLGAFLLLGSPGVLIALSAARFNLSAPVTAVMVGLITVPLVTYFGIRWGLIFPIMVMEKRFGRAALSRSSELVRSAWWRTFWIALVPGVIFQVPVVVIDKIAASIPVLGGLVVALTNAASLSYTTLVLVVYYFDRRCRTEGFNSGPAAPLVES